MFLASHCRPALFSPSAHSGKPGRWQRGGRTLQALDDPAQRGCLEAGTPGPLPSVQETASLTGLGPSGAPSTKVQITKADASTPSSTAAPDTTGSPEPKCDSACVCWVGVISPSLPGQNLRLALGAVEINFKRANPLPIPTCPPLYSLCEIYLRVVPSERQGSGRPGPQAEVGAS